MRLPTYLLIRVKRSADSVSINDSINLAGLPGTWFQQSCRHSICRAVSGSCSKCRVDHATGSRISGRTWRAVKATGIGAVLGGGDSKSEIMQV